MAEDNASPISAAKPPVANPMASATSVHASTLKLKPVIRKPTIGGGAARTGLNLPTAAKPVAPAAAEAPAESAVEQLKSVTQKLKGITQQIPQQAILHKTGIIAEQDLTEAQKAASKSRTARISLSDVMGVAPVKNEAAPMKTIRIKRPDVPAQNTATVAPAPAPAPEPAPAEAPAEADATITQRKTLKIARPTAGARPTGKFGVKKPTVTATKAEAPAGGDVPEVADVADIPDMPAATARPMPSDVCPPDRIPDVGPACQWMGLIVQVAACIAMGFLAWKLYEVTTLAAHVGGIQM